MGKSEPLTPTVINLTLAQTDMEEGVTIPVGCKGFTVTVDANVKMSFSPGDIDAGTYFTIKNQIKFESPDKLSWSGDLATMAADPNVGGEQGEGGGGGSGGDDGDGDGDTGDGGGGGGGEPDEAVTLLWGWEDAQIDKTAFDAYVNASNSKFDLESNGRLTANTNKADFIPAGTSTRLNFPINYEAPSCDSDGKIRAYVKADNTNEHSMLRATNTSEFPNRWYLAPRVHYRFRSTFEIPSGPDWSTVIDGIIFQLHPGTFPSGHSGVPPAAVTIRGGDDIFRVRLYGNTGDPYNSTYDLSPSFSGGDWAFSEGVHTLQVDWVCDPTGSNSSFVVKMDTGSAKPTTERVNTTNKFGLKFSGNDSNEAFLTATHGLYVNNGATPIPAAYPQVIYHNAKLWRVE